MGNAYLKKQTAAQNAVFDTAQDFMLQFCVDLMTIVFHKRGYGAERMKDAIEDFMQLHDKYLTAFDVKHPEADYHRELLDREMRSVFGDEASPFEERYPMAKKIRYDKPMKQHKKRR